MQLQINAPHVDVPDAFEGYIERRAHEVLGPFVDKLTRIEVHLSDQNGASRAGVDMRCVLEARPRAMDPVAVDVTAETPRDAVRIALDKMKHALDHRLGKRADRGRQSP